MPSASVRSASSGSSMPAAARLPNTPRPNRQPSSSRQATAVSVRSAPPSSAIASIASIAATTPRAPSNRPPSGGVSRCEPLQISPEVGRLAGQPAEQVARRVNGDVEAGLLHPLLGAPERPLLALAQPGPVGAGGAADLEQLVQPPEDPLRPARGGETPRHRRRVCQSRYGGDAGGGRPGSSQRCWWCQRWMVRALGGSALWKRAVADAVCDVRARRAGGEQALGLNAQRGPGVGAGAVACAPWPQRAQVRIERLMPGGCEAARRLPQLRHRQHEVPAAALRQELDAGVAAAEGDP